MKLSELKEQVDNAVAYAKECGIPPEEILVTLQIDRADDESIWSDEDVELHYDNNCQASGCVLTAFKDSD